MCVQILPFVPVDVAEALEGLSIVLQAQQGA